MATGASSRSSSPDRRGVAAGWRHVRWRAGGWSRSRRSTRGGPYSFGPMAAGDGAPAPVQAMCLRPLSPGLATPTVPHLLCFVVAPARVGKPYPLFLPLVTWQILRALPCLVFKLFRPCVVVDPCQSTTEISPKSGLILLLLHVCVCVCMLIAHGIIVCSLLVCADKMRLGA